MIKCPIINQEIDIGECVTIVDISDGCIKESMLPENILKVSNWKEICNNCEYHNN
jgi:hypothetical protein